MKFDRSRINRILVINPGTIEDVIHAAPVIENLRHNFPGAIINFLTQKHCKEALSGNPYLTRILTYDLATDSSYCLVKTIRGQNYDLIIDLFCSPRTALITFLSAARYRAGYLFRFRSYAYNMKVKKRSGLDILRRLGLEIRNPVSL